MDGSRRRIRCFIAAVFLAAGLPAQVPFSDADLASPDAGKKLLTAAAAENRAAEAVGLLARYAPRLPDGKEKRAAFAALAGLRELAGDFTGAAESWLAASAAEKSAPDPDAVFSAARCLMAVGESHRAAAELDALANARPEPEVSAKVALFKAYAGAFLREAGAGSALGSFAASAEYGAERPLILFLLARFYSDKAAAARLAEEYPASPEARVLSSPDTRLGIGPHWLIAADRSAVIVREKEPQGSAEQNVDSAGGGEPSALQVGLFREEKNARALAAKLNAKGFDSSVESRTIRGANHFAVTVEPGPSAAETAMRLKDAGFESYPLF